LPAVAFAQFEIEAGGKLPCDMDLQQLSKPPHCRQKSRTMQWLTRATMAQIFLLMYVGLLHLVS